MTNLLRPPGTLVPKALCFTREVFFFLGRPEPYSSGRPYVLLQMFSFIFFPPRDLRAPSADRRETLPHDRNMGALYNASPKIRGPSPKEIGAKNMQNSARFQTTSDFDREYLRNGSRYPKSENELFTSDSCCVLEKVR